MKRAEMDSLGSKYNQADVLLVQRFAEAQRKFAKHHLGGASLIGYGVSSPTETLGLHFSNT